MRTLFFLLRKEFRQIFRNKSIVRLIMAMPVMQLIVLPWAADYEVKNIWLHVVDKDKSTYSKQLIDKVTSSGYFKIVGYSSLFTKGMTDIEKGTADIILEIPQHFERTLIKENKAKVFIAANAVNGSKASVGTNYLGNIIHEFNNDVREEWISVERFYPLPQVQANPIYWYNVKMNYKFFMVPGVLVLLLTIVGTSLSSLNIVKEKEVGTIEQINVTPVKKIHFLLGKLIPFLLMGLVILTLGFLVAWLVYGIYPIEGIIGYLSIYFYAIFYLLAVLGLGLFISVIASTQQQALLISFFFMMIFVLMGGLFTPIESMPRWSQVITWFNPIRYFIEVMRLVVLKGSGIKDILHQLGIICIFAVVLNTLAIYNFKKTNK